MRMTHAVATDGLAWSVCRFITFVSSAKTAEPIEMPFEGWLMLVQGPVIYLFSVIFQCIRWCEDRTKPFATMRGDKMVMRPFIRILWPIVVIVIVVIIITFSLEGDETSVISVMVLTDSFFSVLVTVLVICHFSRIVIVKVNWIIFFSYFAISVTVTVNLNNTGWDRRGNWAWGEGTVGLLLLPSSPFHAHSLFATSPLASGMGTKVGIGHREWGELGRMMTRICYVIRSSLLRNMWWLVVMLGWAAWEADESLLQKDADQVQLRSVPVRRRTARSFSNSTVTGTGVRLLHWCSSVLKLLYHILLTTNQPLWQHLRSFRASLQPQLCCSRFLSY